MAHTGEDLRGIKRFVAVGSVVSLIVLALPTAAFAAVTCALATGTLTLTYGVAGDTARVVRGVGADGNLHTMDDAIDVFQGATQITCSGGPTVSNTDTILTTMTNTGGTSDSLTIDMSNGPFAPGSTDETGNFDEIEFSVNGRNGSADALTITACSALCDNAVIGDTKCGGTNCGFASGDRIAVGITAGNFNLNESETTGDIDFTLFSNVELRTISGGAGDDEITASGSTATGATFASAMTINGDAGDDDLTGSSAADTIAGGAGYDSIAGRAGIDTLNGDTTGGNTDVDTLNYSASALGVTVTLPTTVSGGDAASDVISNFENVVGSNTAGQVDTLTGDAVANVLVGGPGADVLSGGAGNDILSGQAGGDTLNGDDGDDILSPGNDAVNDTVRGGTAGGSDASTKDLVSYSRCANPVQISLLASTAAGCALTSDAISAIEQIRGSNFADTLTGNDSVNYIAGGPGADAITAGAGNDLINGGRGADGTALVKVDGGDGNDTINGGDGDDFLTGGNNNDAIDGEAGSDTCTAEVESNCELD